MSKMTINELQEKLERANNIIVMQAAEISNLHKKLEATKKGLDIVSSSEFKSVITELESNKTLYKVLEQQKDKEILRLKNKIDYLIDKIQENSSSEIKTEHNSRGAGRKEFQDYATVKRIYDLYKSSESLQDIANILNKEYVKTKSGGTWSKSSVRFILLNHTYVTKGVIDEETFNLISERMKGTRKYKLMTEDEYNKYRNRTNILRRGLREMGHTHEETKDLPPYDEYIKNFNNQ
jgi:hypothetical protein